MWFIFDTNFRAFTSRFPPLFFGFLSCDLILSSSPVTLQKNYLFMKKVIAILTVLLAGIAIFWFLLRTKETQVKAPKQTAMTVKQHSDVFNTSVNNLMVAYFGMKDGFVAGDTLQAKAQAAVFISLLDSLPLAELDKDSAAISATAKFTIEDLKANANSLLQQADITEMRQDFRTLSDMLYPGFFKIINYEGPALYLQNCPMAFNGDQDANWISNSSEVVNPYLGKNHPKYKGTMLHCGEVKDSLDAN